MSRMGQIAVAVITSAVACVGGAAAIGNVTGASPMMLISPSSVASPHEFTVANPNDSKAPDIRVDVTGDHVLEPADTPTATTKVDEAPVHRPVPSAPAVVKSATPSPQPSVQPSVTPTPTATLPSVGSIQGSSGDDNDSDDSHNHKHSEHESDNDDD